jgi:hypothetical protein
MADRKTTSDDEISERRADVARLYLMGWTQAAIGVKWEVSQQQISEDIKAVRAEWMESRKASYDQWIAQELARIDVIEANAWEQWARSCQDAVTVKTAQGTGGETGWTKDERIVSEQPGDPRFLTVALNCVERRSKLLGLDAPERHQHGLTTDDAQSLARKYGLENWKLPRSQPEASDAGDD